MIPRFPAAGAPLEGVTLEGVTLGGVAAAGGVIRTAGMLVVGRVAGNADEIVGGRGAGGAIGRTGGRARGGGPGGRAPARTGVGMAGRAGDAPVSGAAAALAPIAAEGGAPSGGRICVTRGPGAPEGGAGIRDPGIGGVIFESDGRGGGALDPRGGATSGATDGATGAATGACETFGVVVAAGGAELTGVARGGAGLGVWSVGRGARATTPGVKVGVGLRRCGGTANGALYGIAEDAIDGRTGVARGGGIGGGIGGDTGGDTGVAAGVRSRAGRSKFSGAAAASDSCIARRDAGGAAPARSDARCAPDSAVIPTWMTAPQTEHRARTPPSGTLAGSTRNTDWHSPHVTFNVPPSPARATPA